MLKIFLFGSGGKMGRAVREAAAMTNVEIVGGFDLSLDGDITTYNSVDKIPNDFDVIIDFSRPALLGDIIKLSDKYRKPVVIATTGYTEEDTAKIEQLSTRTAVLKSGNMSLGVNMLLSLVEQAAKSLGNDFDVEIIEKHHNQKLDAPSGTAVMLADKVLSSKPDSRIVYGRRGDEIRKAGDVGMHSVRGGTIVGEHEVIFAGNDEVVTLSHMALSRKIFASGALKAAAYLKDKQPGLYTMKDVIG